MNEALPKGWIETELGQIVLHRKGKKPKSTIPTAKDGYVPYILIDEMEGKPIRSYTNDKTVPIAKDEDILIVWDGSIGKTATGLSGAIGSTIAALTPIIIPSNFLEAFLKLSKPTIEQTSRGTGLQHINQTTFWPLSFPLPPLNEQKRIASKLDKIIPRIDTIKERMDKIPAVVKRFKQSVLTAAVTGELTEKWRAEHPDVESAEELLSRIKKNRIEHAENQRELNAIKKNYEEGEERLKLKESPYELPQRWFFCEINSIGNVNNGSTPSRKISKYWNGNINWVSSGEVANSSIRKTRETITEKGFKNSSVKLLPVGTVLIAMIGEGKTRGQTAILEIESTCNQNVAAVVINHGLVLSRYLFLWFLMQYERNRSFGSGSGPKALNCQRVRELDFIFPPLEEQKEIVRQVDKLFALADRLESHYQKAKAKVDTLSQSVLAKAFRGDLVITEAELAEKEGRDFESAEKLLERIMEEKAKFVGRKKTKKETVRQKK